MKKLFTAIRKGDLVLVRELLGKNHELISCTAKQPPKKDDGQSPLQVAIKCGQLKIALYLLDLGADVNYMETESCNEWKMPVVQDAIMRAVMSARFLRYTYLPGDDAWEICRSKEQFDEAFGLLKRMLDSGADIKSHDSYGNSCLGRALLDARQILPSTHYSDPSWVDPRPLNKELKEDLDRVFGLLIEHGADVHEVDKNSGGKSHLEFYKGECVGTFIAKK